MALETPNSGTLREAQEKVMGLLDPSPEAAPEEPVTEPSPEEPIEEPTADEGLLSTESDTEDDYTDDEEEPPRTFKLNLNGEEVELTEEELLKGYSRQSDYTRKTQDLAEQRKRLDSIIQETDAARDRYSQILPELEANLSEIQKQLNAEPDWDKLSKADPVKALQLQREFDRRKQENAAELERVKQEQQQLLADQQKRFMQEREDHLQAQGKLLLENIPEWQDEEVASKQKQEIEQWALNNGFLDADQLNSIQDWGYVAMMRKAWLFDQGATAAKKSRAKTSKTLSPGSKERAAPTRTAFRDARAKAKKSGKMADAQALIEMHLNNQSKRR